MVTSPSDAVERLAKTTPFLDQDQIGPEVNVSELEVRDLMVAIGATRLARTTLLDRIQIPTYYCVRPSALHPCAIYSSGKGLNTYHAKISAVFECYERWAAESAAFTATETVDCMVRIAPSMNMTVLGLRNLGPEPITWAFGRNVLTNQIVVAPAGIVEFPSAQTHKAVTTTGLAAHTTNRGAILNGYFECLERHYTARMNCQSLRRLSFRDFPDHIQRLARAFETNEIELHAFLITSVDCFVVYCFSYDHWIGLPQMHCSGFAASSCVAQALEKAILEVVQGRAAYISGLRDDVRQFVVPKARQFDSRRQFDWLERMRAIQKYYRVDQARDGFAPLAETALRISSKNPAKTPACFPLRTTLNFPAFRVLIPELDDCN